MSLAGTKRRLGMICMDYMDSVDYNGGHAELARNRRIGSDGHADVVRLGLGPCRGGRCGAAGVLGLHGQGVGRRADNAGPFGKCGPRVRPDVELKAVGAPVQGFSSPLGLLVPLAGDFVWLGSGLTVLRVVSALAGRADRAVSAADCGASEGAASAPAAVLAMGYAALEHHQISWGMSGMETQLATLALVASSTICCGTPFALGSRWVLRSGASRVCVCGPWRPGWWCWRGTGEILLVTALCRRWAFTCRGWPSLRSITARPCPIRSSPKGWDTRCGGGTGS